MKKDDEVMVENETTQTNERSVFELNGCYYKNTQGRNPHLKLISNVTLKANAKVIMNNDWYFQCTAIKNTGEVYDNIILSKNNLLCASAMTRALSIYPDILYYGDKHDTTQIRGILAEQTPPVKQGTKVNGLHQIGNEWVYVEGANVLGKDGDVDNIVFTGKSTEQFQIPSLTQQKDIDLAQLKDIANLLFKFHDPSITYLVIGYVGYCFMKPRISPKVNNRNTIMHCQGAPNSGKSEVFFKILQPIFSDNNSRVNIAHASECAMAIKGSSTNLTPVFYEEWKLSVMSKRQIRIAENMLLAAFAQTPITRGRPDMTINDMILTAPIFLNGEMTLESSSLKHRFIDVYFSKAKQGDTLQYFKQLEQLPLGSFGKGLPKRHNRLKEFPSYTNQYFL